ncbi:hypothetical protein ACHAQH_009275, partial [Verticillium albo-atrum]
MLSSTISKTIELALLLVATTAQAGPMPEPTDLDVGLPEGFTEVPLEWELQSHPGGEVFTMTGTVEKVRAELTKRNPNYLADFGLEERDETEDHALVSRDLCKTSDWRLITCSVSGGRAQTRATREGIHYLEGISGKPKLGAGPNICSRVSCSHNSGIWWCNHHDKAWSLGSFKSIAKGAQCAYNKCQANAKIKGQSFAKGSNWSVMVKGAN